jgi:hypothetical protein
MMRCPPAPAPGSRTARETLSATCRPFAQQREFRTAGTNVVACVVQEWSANGTQLIQERQFGFTASGLNVFAGE